MFDWLVHYQYILHYYLYLKVNNNFIVIYSDPDAGPKLKEFHHWLIGNIPGGDVNMGETLTAYVGSATPPKTGRYLPSKYFNFKVYKLLISNNIFIFVGLHRYVLLVYKQPSKLVFDEPHISNR